MRDMSGSGPIGPIFFGVWQSLQPPAVTSVFPRATSASCDIAAGPDELPPDADDPPALGACEHPTDAASTALPIQRFNLPNERTIIHLTSSLTRQAPARP
jgi:hypothetical protein